MLPRPTSLLVLIPRFNDSSKKLHNPCIIPETIKEPISPSTEYSLTSVIYHVGDSIDHGHYTSSTERGRGQGWNLWNDATCESTTIHCVTKATKNVQNCCVAGYTSHTNEKRLDEIQIYQEEAEGTAPTHSKKPNQGYSKARPKRASRVLDDSKPKAKSNSKKKSNTDAWKRRKNLVGKNPKEWNNKVGQAASAAKDALGKSFVVHFHLFTL